MFLGGRDEGNDGLPGGKAKAQSWRTYLRNARADGSGDDVKEAFTAFDQENNRPYVALNFAAKGADKFGQLTGRNVKRRMAIMLGGAAYQAGQKLRDKLLAIAAHQWSAPASELRYRDGGVDHPATGRTLAWMDPVLIAPRHIPSMPPGRGPGTPRMHAIQGPTARRSTTALWPAPVTYLPSSTASSLLCQLPSASYSHIRSVAWPSVVLSE